MAVEVTSVLQTRKKMGLSFFSFKDLEFSSIGATVMVETEGIEVGSTVAKELSHAALKR